MIFMGAPPPIFKNPPIKKKLDTGIRNPRPQLVQNNPIDMIAGDRTILESSNLV